MRRVHAVDFRFARIGILALLLIWAGSAVVGEEIAPIDLRKPADAMTPPLGIYSARTLAVGIEISRDDARLVAYTVKQRPFVAPLAGAAPRAYEDGQVVQVEVTLIGPGNLRYTRRVDAGPICLTHAPGFEDHIEGDTIRVHRDSFIVRLPELEGFDRIDVAYYQQGRSSAERKPLVLEKLDRARFTPAGTSRTYASLAFADTLTDPAPETSRVNMTGTVIWPEDREDPDIYQVFGNEAETGRRINISIVPDGYTYPEKALMEAHAAAVVADFRAKSPYAEHDPFINYTLVYAYSRYSGTDQCDCDIVLNTAMGTRFPDAGFSCGNSGNRCLYYGNSCDTGSTENIVAAELRAPATDQTMVMVNTTRYGGCGGARAVYSAGHSLGPEVAVHELGHSLGGLADEYAGNDSCSAAAGGVNTSTDSVNGSWPEWIDEIGAPREGAQYYNFCRFRPKSNCEMRSLNQPFCEVCKQHWSLVYFGHPRIFDTAPIESIFPDQPSVAEIGVPAEYSFVPRFAVGPQVTNSIEWYVDPPGQPGPVLMASGTTTFSHIFDEPGVHTVSAVVTADTNFIKPERYGANQGTAVYSVTVSELAAPFEVSPPGAVQPLIFTDGDTLGWEEAANSGASSFNIYRAELSGVAAGDYGSCLEPTIAASSFEDPAMPAAGSGWAYLVTGNNPAGEGPMGNDSALQPRPNGSACP